MAALPAVVAWWGTRRATVHVMGKAYTTTMSWAHIHTHTHTHTHTHVYLIICAHIYMYITFETMIFKIGKRTYLI